MPTPPRQNGWGNGWGKGWGNGWGIFSDIGKRLGMLTYIGNKFFTFLCNFLFKLKITDVLFTYAMGSTLAFKNLNLKFNDFSFCVELPIKAKFKNYNLENLPSHERSRSAGIKKVNEFKDGFFILISILRLLIFKK